MGGGWLVMLFACNWEGLQVGLKNEKVALAWTLILRITCGDGEVGVEVEGDCGCGAKSRNFANICLV